jgi:predicted dehydrogenase
MARKIGVGMIGAGFMGKTHSNAYYKVHRFFKVDAEPEMRVLCALPEAAVKAFAQQWGWEEWSTNYKEVVKREDLDLIDVNTPNNLHAEVSIAALEAGKNVICEKPLAMDVKQCKAMVAAAKKSGKLNMVSFNYRRVPAVSLAKKMIQEGKLGKIFHVRSSYLQDWIMDPKFPRVWRLVKAITGSGAHGDLNAHIVDLARYLVGDFEEVVGHAETFIKERPLMEESIGLTGKAGKKMGKVDVDDAVVFIARMKGGAIGTFEATRFAAGRRNQNQFEINGDKGTLVWQLERMNELQYFSREECSETQGFRTIIVTQPEHPYMQAWWPPGHIVGYEHSFINEIYDLVQAVANNKPVTPTFEDGLKCQEILDAVLKSAEERRWVKISEMK